jgi:tetratricopeptide (TPR) repeat protein
MVEADKQAAKEAASNKVPNLQLLQARLLFDGAYYDKAYQKINQLDEQTLTNTALKTEYYYRKGRILHEWNKLEAALLNYDKTMATGKNLPLYFAANASFESGQIWEKKGDTAKAKEYYQNCLAYSEHEYKNSIDQKAKVALSRIK